MYLKFIVFLAFILCGSGLRAQVLNVEKSRLNTDSSNYFVGSLGLLLNANNQSIDSDGEAVSFIGLKLNSDLGYISKLNSYLLLSQFNYTATSSQAINSTGYGHFRINFLRSHKLSYETFTQLQYDQGRGMGIRWLGGGGIRYNFLQQDKISMYLGLGGMYEEETWEVPGETTIRRTLKIWKSTNYVSTRVVFNKNVNLNLITYYQTGYDFDREFFRHRINADININANILSKLALTTSLFGSYENRPVVPISKFVYSVSNGVIFTF